MLHVNDARVRDALAFAEECHRNQSRGSANLPYVVHIYAVTSLIYRYQNDFGDHLEDSLVAGSVHDTVEDCGVTFEILESKFGRHAALMASAMTKSELLVKSKGKLAALEHSLDRCEAIGPHCLALKCLDRVDNLFPITMPVKWSPKRRHDYVYHEAQAILDRARKVGLRETPNRLENAMDIFKRYI